MNVKLKREFTPYAFGCTYCIAYPDIGSHYNVEEIASTFYSKRSKAWKLFIQGFNKEYLLYKTTKHMKVI